MRSLACRVLTLVILGSLPLAGQSYQTSFSEVKFDRGKSPATLHGQADVEGASGALSVRIPLGPGIGIRNLHYAPALVGRWHPQAGVGSKPNMDATGRVTSYSSHLMYGDRSGFALDPGHLMLSLGDPSEEQQYAGSFSPATASSNALRPVPTTMSNFQLPNGESGSVIGSEGGFGAPPYLGIHTEIIPGVRIPSVAEAKALLAAYGFGPEWTIGAHPYHLMLDDLSAYANESPFVSLGTNGELILGIVRVADLPGSVKIIPYARIEKMGYSNSRVCVPLKILILKGDILSEFDWVRDDYGPYVGGWRAAPGSTTLEPPTSFLHGAQYTCVSQRNRFGDRLRFAPNDAATGGFRVWIESNGTAVGPEIRFSATAKTLSYRMEGRDIPMFSFEGLEQVLNAGSPPCGLGGLDAVKLTTLRNLATNETLGFGYGEAQFPSGDYFNIEFPFPVLTSLNEAGKSTVFTWESYSYLRTGNLPQGGGYSGLYIQNNRVPGPQAGFHPCFAAGVTEIKETAGSVVRSTLHARVLPTPNLTPNWDQWTSTAFTNTITLPDARKVKTLYVEPLYGKIKGATLQEDLQLLAYTKHLERRREEYDATGKLVKVVEHPIDSLSLRHFVNPTGVASGNYTPYFTRTITTTYDAATGAEVSRVEQEQKDFDELNPGWRTETLKASSGGVAQANRTTTRAFKWRSDLGTVMLTTFEALPGKPAVTSAYDTHGRPFLQTFNEGGAGSSLSLSYGYQPTGVAGFNYVPGPAPSTITVSGGSDLKLSGQVGVRYGYDVLGRVERIGRLGVAWTVAQSTDPLGRVISQTDPNGLVRTFDWDDGGRLKAIRPQGEVPTEYTYDPDFLGVAIQRGVQYSRLRFNGFGEFIREIRKNGAGVFSHRLFGYDFGGRKAWESIWLPQEGNDTTWSSELVPGEFMTGAPARFDQQCTQWVLDRNTGERRCRAYAKVYTPPQNPTYSALKSTHYTYDPQGRVMKVTDPNGVVQATAFSKGPSGERRAVTVGSGAEAATTTFDHDGLGRLSGVIDALSQPTTYAYDDADRIQQVIQKDPANATRTQTRTWGYNALGWLTSLIQPESGTTSYSDFDVNGKSWTTNYNGRVVNATFDALGRPLSMAAADGSVNQAFTWDTAPTNGKGQLHTATADGAAREMDYGGVGGRLSQLTRKVDGTSFIQTLTYDGYGTLSFRSYPNGQSQTLTPDAATGLPVTSLFNGAQIMPLAVYDPTHWGLTSLTLANGASTTFTYGPDQARLGSMRHQATGLNKLWTYAYDTVGRMTSDSANWYGYDKLSRLVRAFERDPFDSWGGGGNQGIWQTFAFDAFGNRTKLESRTVTNWTQGSAPPAPGSEVWIPTSKAKSYSFSATDTAFLRNQLPASTASGVPTGARHDAQGNLTAIYKTPGQATEAVTLTYDALGRVKTMADASRNVVEAYTYDDEGLRITTEIYLGSIAPQNLQKKQYRIYNEARQMVAEYELVKE